jgi:hypothetical protein
MWITNTTWIRLLLASLIVGLVLIVLAICGFVVAFLLGYAKRRRRRRTRPASTEDADRG